MKDEDKTKEQLIKEINDLRQKFARIKEFETSLKESEERYRGFYESSIDGIVSLDTNGHIMECNQAFADMLGYTKEEMRKLTVYEITPSKWLNTNKEFHKQLIVAGYSQEYEKEYIRKDGTIIPVVIKGWIIQDNEGKPTGMWGVIRDITERKQSEKELLLKDIVFESAFAANSTADEKGNLNHVNPAFLKMWGYENKKEVIGNPIGQFFMNKDELPPIVNALNTHGKWEGEFLAKRKDGSTFISEGFATVIRDKNGNITGYHSANIDITEKKQAEEQLKEYSVRSEAEQRGLIAPEKKPAQVGRRPLIRRTWTPEEAEGWSREDWIAIVLSPAVYALIIMGVARLLLGRIQRIQESSLLTLLLMSQHHIDM